MTSWESTEDELEFQEYADKVYKSYTANKPTKLQRHKCPVCTSYLGERPKDEEKSFHCEDCRAWYTYFPNIKKPLARLDKDIPEQCTCGGCRQRRGDPD